MDRIAIITGSSSGFGLLTTIKLAEQGFHVIATMRNLKKAEIFNKLIKKQDVFDRIQPRQLDVTDKVSIGKFSEYVKGLERVDVLVNNAGFAIGGFAEHVEIDDYRRQFETNLFGVIAVTQAILPKMHERGMGTIINVSSVSGRTAFPGLSAYVSSKYALEGYTESLRLELKPFGIQVALVEPGSFQTNIWSSGMEISERSADKQSPYYDYMTAITSALESGKKNHGDPVLVANLISKIASMKELKKLRYPIGKGLKATILMKALIPWKWWEKIVLKTILKK
ncbi:SDR family oxidoreductase [Aquibacillus halophilus]|uniref:SDR family oxidoreductase n=1 Tax=Aquibacillus halophilus TaxID=930132 RepID=A0A6A8DFU7_9BACI|nr:SDR family oxidoreductase [Aquibacillus halophilus]MRH43416.1 SDR family oxidoreductase [Aquibacillus halophilus]